MNANVAIIGFATLDYVLTTERPIVGPGTVLANALSSDWPRAGGAALYAARRLHDAGHAVSPIVSIGDDAHGVAYNKACEAAGIALDGVFEVKGGKTTCCFLIYHDDGRYTCLLDIGTAAAQTLSSEQAEIVDAADLVIIAAAEARLIERTLKSLKTSQQVAWIAKNDPSCFPLDLCRSLAERADFIFYNSSERHLVEPFLDRVKPHTAVFETRGAAGVQTRRGNDQWFIPATPLDIDDATGAGDTFAGATLAAMLIQGTTPAVAAKNGVDQVHRFLASRIGMAPSE
ncbi:MAG: carbohydrate kinase family protein [Sphingomonadaceae bacterium]|nr:carbohydrate kinase family protein [Sphingomonadaceae bacterium]